MGKRIGFGSVGRVFGLRCCGWCRWGVGGVFGEYTEGWGGVMSV